MSGGSVGWWVVGRLRALGGSVGLPSRNKRPVYSTRSRSLARSGGCGEYSAAVSRSGKAGTACSLTPASGEVRLGGAGLIRDAAVLCRLLNSIETTSYPVGVEVGNLRWLSAVRCVNDRARSSSVSPAAPTKSWPSGPCRSGIIRSDQILDASPFRSPWVSGIPDKY